MGEMQRLPGITHHRAEGIPGLPDIELFVIPLSFSGSDVIDNGVTPDMVHRILFLYPIPSFPDYDTNFSLVVEGLGELRVREDRISVCDDRRGSLRKDDRMRWLVDLV